MDIISKIWELFWSIWPKNFYVLVLISALCEAGLVIMFKVTGNRGLLSIIGYILGFLAVAFYAESLKYSRVAQSYPIWLALAAILILVGSVFILREKVSPLWFVGFIFAIVGVVVIQLSLPPEK